MRHKYYERVLMSGNRVQHTQYQKPASYFASGAWQAIVNDYVDGDVNFPHVVSAAPVLLYTAPDGMRRICPTHDAAIYAEIGAPYIKPAATWQQVSLNPFTRAANRLLSVNANVDVSLWMGGHVCKLEFELKGGYVPPNNQVAFPVGLSGLTRTGDTLYANGVAVMRLHAPFVYDVANPLDRRAVAYQFVSVSGQAYLLFTLPDLTGMARPVVDPTLSLQPDATAGIDTTLEKLNPTWNDGISTNLVAGDNSGDGSKIYRSLLQFDLSAIFPGSLVHSAILTLYDNFEADGNTRQIGVFAGLAPFYEGVKNGAAPDAGQDGSTWNKRNANGPVNWASDTPGGLQGSDYANGSTWTTPVTSPQGNYFNWDVTIDVQKWLTGYANYGWWLRIDGSETSQLFKQFSSGDHATQAQRPKLVVTYTPNVPIWLYKKP